MSFVIYEFGPADLGDSAFAYLEDNGERLTLVISDDDDEFGFGLTAASVAQLVEALRPYHD